MEGNFLNIQERDTFLLTRCISIFIKERWVKIIPAKYDFCEERKIKYDVEYYKYKNCKEKI